MKVRRLQLVRKMVARLTYVRTPSSNTGLDSQPRWSVGIDWLDVTIRGIESGAARDDVIQAFEEILSSPADFCASRSVFNGKQWKGSGVFESKARLWWNPPRFSDDAPLGDILDTSQGEEPVGCDVSVPGLKGSNMLLWNAVGQCYIGVSKADAPSQTDVGVVEPGSFEGDSVDLVGNDSFPEVGELKIAIPGGALSRCDIGQVLDYLNVISGVYCVDCSRIDIALDDNTKAVDIGEVERASSRGDYFNARYSQRIESGNRGEAIGKTVYFGSPRSDAKMRVYDKTVESKGVSDCNRWEVEFHRGKADRFFESLRDWYREDASQVAQKLVDVVVSFVDFRDRSSGDPNRGRCPRLQWYTEMLRDLCEEVIRIRVPVPAIALQKTIDWIDSSVAQSISSVRDALGDDFWPYMQALLSSGKERMSNVRRKAVAMCDRNKLIYSRSC